MLLLLTLRDVAENRLPLGFGPNRGMGEIEVKSNEFIGSGKLKLKKLSEKDGKIVEDEEIEIDLKDALSATVEAGRCKFAEGILREQIQLRWKQWLK
jgi:CRISPR/Cas system CSM-associated protein Csm3 (group 7 of RAMP superfamily)